MAGGNPMKTLPVLPAFAPLVVDVLYYDDDWEEEDWEDEGWWCPGDDD